MLVKASLVPKSGFYLPIGYVFRFFFLTQFISSGLDKFLPIHAAPRRKIPS